jgi:hypothetical protein
VDVLGNPTYDVLTQSAADNQAAYVAAVGDFMDTVGAANPPPAPPSATPTSWLVLGAVALGLVAVSVMSGRGH